MNQVETRYLSDKSKLRRIAYEKCRSAIAPQERCRRKQCRYAGSKARRSAFQEKHHAFIARPMQSASSIAVIPRSPNFSAASLPARP